MGEISISGDGALHYVNLVTTNDVSRIDPYQAQYTAMLNDEGGVIDDLVVYRREHDYLLVVNAVNVRRDVGWLKQRAPAGVKVEDLSDDTGQIALQGPRAVEVMAKVCPQEVLGLGYFRSIPSRVGDIPCLVSRTGYTGEDGFEIYSEAARAAEVWDTIMEKAPRPAPCGLGARDTLRLEMAFRLHGSDMDETTTPLEAGLGWIVKLEKGDFCGKRALLEQKRVGVPRRLIGLKTAVKRFPRAGCVVWVEGKRAGEVTSGGFSPSLDCGIALAYVDAEYAKRGAEFEIEIRDRMVDASLVKGPFYKKAEKD
jgi:aminomethyltransferase